jgi:hypothetical protein
VLLPWRTDTSAVLAVCTLGLLGLALLWRVRNEFLVQWKVLADIWGVVVGFRGAAAYPGENGFSVQEFETTKNGV